MKEPKEKRPKYIEGVGWRFHNLNDMAASICALEQQTAIASKMEDERQTDT